MINNLDSNYLEEIKGLKEVIKLKDTVIKKKDEEIEELKNPCCSICDETYDNGYDAFVDYLILKKAILESISKKFSSVVTVFAINAPGEFCIQEMIEIKRPISARIVANQSIH